MHVLRKQQNWVDLTKMLVHMASSGSGNCDAEDLAQTAILRLLERYPSESRKEPGNVESPPSDNAFRLARTILSNLVKDDAKSARNSSTTLVDFADLDSNRVRIWCIEDFSCLGSLREMPREDLLDHHAAVLQRHVEGDSDKEIAAALRKPLGTVKSILHRLRKQLVA